MGINLVKNVMHPAPLMAYFVLYFYEKNFMEYLKKNDPERAKKVRHILRFIDDLIAMNVRTNFLNRFVKFILKKWKLKSRIQTAKALHTSILIGLSN